MSTISPEVAEKLPSIHIDYSDVENIHVVFEGCRLPMTAEQVSMAFSDPAYLSTSLRPLIGDEYKSIRSWPRTDEFLERLGAKIVAKLQRLPHTSAWLVFHQ